MFKNIKYDYNREAKKHSKKGKLGRTFNVLWSLGFQSVINYRLCRWLVCHKIPLIHIILQRMTEVITGVSIPPSVKIGKGLLIEHYGGIVVNSKTEIGENCTISHQVTIGNKIPGGNAPKIGNNVYICVGAKILGEIKIGNYCIIGADALVLKDVPNNSIVAGNPAKVVKTITDMDKYKDFFG